MNRHQAQSPWNTRKVSLILIPALFALVPLVYDSDLHRFSLLPKLALVQGITLFLSFLWARDRTISWSAPTTFLPATLFILWSAISTLATDLNVFAATRFLAQLVTFYILYVAISQMATIETIEQSLKWACGSGLVFALIGVAEFWGVDVDFIPSNGRPSSTFAYRNFAASYTVAILPIAAVFALRSRKKNDMVLGSVAALMMGLFLVYTRSRGAWLGGLIGLIIVIGLFIIYRFQALDQNSAIRTSMGKWIIAGVVFLFLALAPWSPNIKANHSRGIDEGKAELFHALGSLSASGAGRGRLDLWSSTARMVSDHPLLGVGLDNWRIAYPPYDNGKMIKVGSAPARPHNDFLWIASETGIIGLGFFCWFTLQALYGGLIHISRRDKHAILVAGLLCGLCALLVHSVFSFPRERIETSFFMWTAIAFLHVLSNDTRCKNQCLFAPLGIPLLAACCLLITILHIRSDRALQGGLQAFADGDIISTSRFSGVGLSAGPFDDRLFLLKNKVHQAKQNYPAAQKTCLRGLEYHPNSVELLGDLGMVYALDNKLELAKSTLTRAIQLSPNHYQLYNNLGAVYQKSREYQDAYQAYWQATRIRADHPDAWSNLGLLGMVSGDYTQSIKSFRRAIQHATFSPALHHNLADALYLRLEPGDRAAAAHHYEIFLKAWRGAPSETKVAAARVREIRSQ